MTTEAHSDGQWLRRRERGQVFSFRVTKGGSFFAINFRKQPPRDTREDHYEDRA